AGPGNRPRCGDDVPRGNAMTVRLALIDGCLAAILLAAWIAILVPGFGIVAGAPERAVSEPPAAHLPSGYVPAIYLRTHREAAKRGGCGRGHAPTATNGTLWEG